MSSPSAKTEGAGTLTTRPRLLIRSKTARDGKAEVDFASTENPPFFILGGAAFDENPRKTPKIRRTFSIETRLYGFSGEGNEKDFLARIFVFRFVSSNPIADHLKAL